MVEAGSSTPEPIEIGHEADAATADQLTGTIMTEGHVDSYEFTVTEDDLQTGPFLVLEQMDGCAAVRITLEGEEPDTRPCQSTFTYLTSGTHRIEITGAVGEVYGYLPYLTHEYPPGEEPQSL